LKWPIGIINSGQAGRAPFVAPTPSPNRVWRCSLACWERTPPCASTWHHACLREPATNVGAATKALSRKARRAGTAAWKATIRPSNPSSTPSANSRLRPPSRAGKLDFTSRRTGLLYPREKEAGQVSGLSQTLNANLTLNLSAEGSELRFRIPSRQS